MRGKMANNNIMGRESILPKLKSYKNLLHVRCKFNFKSTFGKGDPNMSNMRQQ